MDAKKITLDDWQEYGVGAYGRTYCHRNNSEILLKLNNIDVPESTTLKEFEFSKAAYDMGIKCPQMYDLVTDGVRFGMTCKRIVNKKSLCRMISEDSSLIDILSQKFAFMAKELHNTPCDTKKFESHKDFYREIVDNCKPISSKMKSTLHSYINEMNDTTNCLHGDLHYGNLIVANGEDFWIDLGRLGYGDPFFDLSAMYTSALWLPSVYIKNIFHVDRKTHLAFFKKMIQYYFGSNYNDKEIRTRLDHASKLRLALYIYEDPNSYFLFGPALYDHTFISKSVCFFIDMLPIPKKLK